MTGFSVAQEGEVLEPTLMQVDGKVNIFRNFGGALSFYSEPVADTDDWEMLPGISDLPVRTGDLFRLKIYFSSKGVAGSNALIPSIDVLVSVDTAGSIDLPLLEEWRIHNGTTIRGFIEMVKREYREKIYPTYLDFRIERPAVVEVLMTGEVQHPGIYRISRVAKLSDGISVAEGFTTIADYRSIRLYYDDGTEKTLDLSEYVLDSKSEANPHLYQVTRIHVPVSSRTVMIAGRVAKSGYYVLKPNEDLSTLLDIAGGLSLDADREWLLLNRKLESGRYTVDTIAFDDARAMPLQHGDGVTVASASTNAPYIRIEGALFGSGHSGVGRVPVPQKSILQDEELELWDNAITVPISQELAFYPGINLHSVLLSMGGPTDYALSDGGFIERNLTEERIPFDVWEMWENPEKAKRIALQPYDRVFVPMVEQLLSVVGEVNNPGIRTYEFNRSVWYYIQKSGGITKNADIDKIWLVTENQEKVDRIDIHYIPGPGNIILVEPEPRVVAREGFDRVFPVITTLIGTTTSIITLITAMISLSTQ